MNSPRRKPTIPTPPPDVEALRAEALQALVGLHDQPPALLVELAECHEYAIGECLREGLTDCPACAVKAYTARLLRAVARMRRATDASLARARAPVRN